MIRLRTCFLVAAALLAISTTRGNADLIFTADLSGAGETPAVPSPGTGFGTFTVNDAKDAIAFTITYQDLLAPINPGGGHIHVGGPTAAGPVILPFPGLPVGTTFGSFSGILTAANLTPAGGITTFDQAVDALINGNTYANLHTQMFPGGEIRGQILPQGGGTVIPEPSALALLGIGGAGLIAYAWRRRKLLGICS